MNAKRRFNPGAVLLTVLTIIAACVWFFPLYWALLTSIRTDQEAVAAGFDLLPDAPTLQNYIYVLLNSNIMRWYLNSTITSVSITFLVVSMGACAGYAISQLRFPGRTLLWWIDPGQLHGPGPGADRQPLRHHRRGRPLTPTPGIILPMLIASGHGDRLQAVLRRPAERLPRGGRDGRRQRIPAPLPHLHLPMNWGVTAALAIITFIGAWNTFLWPFLAVSVEPMMTVTVGITQVQDAFGVSYARVMAGAVLAGLPVAVAYLLFQRRVTQAITLSAGIKG